MMTTPVYVSLHLSARSMNQRLYTQLSNIPARFMPDVQWCRDVFQATMLCLRPDQRHDYEALYPTATTMEVLVLAIVAWYKHCGMGQDLPFFSNATGTMTLCLTWEKKSA